MQNHELSNSSVLFKYIYMYVYTTLSSVENELFAHSHTNTIRNTYIFGGIIEPQRLGGENSRI